MRQRVRERWLDRRATLSEVLLVHLHQLVVELQLPVAGAAHGPGGMPQVVIRVTGDLEAAERAQWPTDGPLIEVPHGDHRDMRPCQLTWHSWAVRALRSSAFGIAVLLTMLLLLGTNIGMWLSSSLLDPPVVGRAVAAAMADPTLRDRVSRQLGEGVAAAVLDQGPLSQPVRRVLDLPARPTLDELAGALTERIDGLFAAGSGGTTMIFASSAFARVIDDLRADGSDARGDASHEGLVVDLTPVARLVLDRIDPSGELGGAIAPDAGQVRLLDEGMASLLVTPVRILDAVSGLLPIVCLMVLVMVLVLARYRVHALAWVGLCGVVAGTSALLVASGAPVLIPRIVGMGDPGALALTEALDGVTADLVTQSAVLAGLGLALVVAGIAGGVVVSRGGDAGRDARHEWDLGRLS